MFEKITFSNGINDYFYSDYLHKINRICDLYGYDIDNYIDFCKAQSLYTSKSYLQPV